jgi:hypothetical protein
VRRRGTPVQQALWSQARERVNVLTIICANSSYAILKARAGCGGFEASGARQACMLRRCAKKARLGPRPAAPPRRPPPLAQVEGARQGVPPPPPPPPPPAAGAAPGGAPAPVPPASQALTSLGSPAIDWVALAAGMGVPGGRAATAGEAAALVRRGLAAEGPFLVMAVI